MFMIISRISSVMKTTKWASRNVYNGTRNVITGMATNVSHPTTLDQLRIMKLVGLYQFMKSVLPVSHI